MGSDGTLQSYQQSFINEFTMRLNKVNSRKRWKEVRDLWNQWDPIGVMGDPHWPRDEYETYLGPTLRFLEEGASNQKIAEYLTYVVSEVLGLGKAGIKHSNPLLFATKLQEWYERSWDETRVKDIPANTSFKNDK
jgi:hypothetical protein